MGSSSLSITDLDVIRARVQLGSKDEAGEIAGNKGKQRACGIDNLSPEPEVGGSNPLRRAILLSFIMLIVSAG